jgi:DNA-binding transcriptional ArsR family regulator
MWSVSSLRGEHDEEELVETRRDGKHIFYRVRSKQALAVLKVLYEQFCINGRKK